jgi:class 3 adenylate cyclase
MTAADHTFLFADLVGFTALTEAEGDERAAAICAALQSHVRGVADRHEAEVVKAMGDAAMLRCGEPSAAIQLALRLVEVVDADPELPPVRVGVHSGPAVSHEGDWYGRAVNVASRLCSVAAGGEVLVSEAALAAAGELPAVSIGERRLHWLKNVTEPVAARATELNRRAGRLSLMLASMPHRLRISLGTHATAGGAR